MLKRIAIVTAVLVCVIAPSVRCLALDILVNEAGYEANAPKIFRAQKIADYAGDGTFTVYKASDDSAVYTGTVTRKGGLWDKYYWAGDFSSLKTAGDYYVSATVNGETGTSYKFTIGSGALLNKTGKLVYQYFTAQRCGTAVSFNYIDRNGNNVNWSHNACHLDDAYTNPSGPHIDGVGGWHDAGDYGKYGHGFCANPIIALLWLYDSNRPYYDAIDTNSNGIADILDEALWQARWLVKIVQANGHVMDNFGQRRTGPSWVKPESDTNNVPGDSDDRWVYPGDENTPQETVALCALIKMHRVLASKGLPTENFADKALAIWNHKWQMAHDAGHNNLGEASSHIFGGLDLYAVFGQQNCWDSAVQKVQEVIDNVNNNISSYDNIVDGTSAGCDLAALAWFARTYPNDSHASAARAAVQTLMSHHMNYLASPQIGLIRRMESGAWQYFPANPSLGLNMLYGYVTWGAIEAYKTIGDPTYLQFALDQYNWLLGANYQRVCMMEAAGYPGSSRYVDKYHTRYDTIITNGIEPGVVPNGFIRDGTGLPWIYFGTGSASVQSNEGWLPNSAGMAMALAAMSVFQDSAQMVSNTIPATMTLGQSLPVSVTVSNTGSVPWTAADNYKLGAVGDSDPFASTRVNLGAGDSIAGAQQKTFNFTMTAPTTPGTYTTDWQMVHDGVGWFGDVLTKSVVVNGTPVAIQTNTFDSDVNGWNISLWQQGGVAPTMGWAANAGCSGGAVQCVGAGSTDGTNSGTREGGEMWKVISTAGNGGYSNINIYFDVKVNGLGNDYSGVGGTGDHNLLEEQLTVYYSTNGGSTWNEAGYLNRAALNGLQTCGTRSYDLSTNSACNNNANFAVKFRWQLNTGPESPSGADIANIDNVVIKGVGAGDATPPGNVTGFTATAGSGQIGLSWTNPTDLDFTGVKILFKTTGYPTSASDGTSIYDSNGTSFNHTGLANGTTYYYKAFAHDSGPNYASGAQASGAPSSGDAAAPTFGGSISPSLTSSLTPAITITAQDTGSGLNVGSAEFAYSLDGGVSFSTYVGRYVLHSKGTGGGGGNMYWYPDFYHLSYTIAAGDHLQYDIYSNNTDGKGSVDLEGSFGNLRDSGKVDQNGLSGHGDTNLYSRDYHQWYHRDFDLSSWAGQTITAYEMSHETDSGVSEYYLRNVIITNNGQVKDRSANADAWTSVTDTVGPGNNGYSSTVGPEMLIGDPASPATCSGSNGTTAVQNVTATFSSSLTSLLVGGNNRIKFRISDMNANRAASSTFTITVDQTPPGNVTNFTATSGDTQITLAWTKPGDADLAGIKIMWKTTGYPTGPTDGTQCYNGTGTGYVHTGLTNGVTYYYKAFAYDGLPNYSSGAQAGAVPADVTGPASVSSLAVIKGDGRNYISWTNPSTADFAGTKILFKTTGYPTSAADGTLVCNRAAAPSSNDSFTQISLTDGVTYYYSAFAYDEVPNYSTSATASGVPERFDPAQAKLLGNNASVILTTGPVSAVWTDSFYAQCADKPIGIRVVKTGHSAVVGQLAWARGTAQTDPTTGEKYILADWAQSYGSGTAKAYAVPNASLGGVDWQYSAASGAGQQGVFDPVGPNNIGLLVWTWGKVTQRDPSLQYFYVDDGAGLRDGTLTGGVANVGLRVKADPSGYPAGSYLVIQGIVSCFKDGAVLKRQVLPIAGGIRIAHP